MLTPTVRVEKVSPFIVSMSWSKNVTVNDVNQAYRDIDAHLNAAPRPIFVLVDITVNPQFPIGATVKGALFGPHQNPKLEAWLVVGTSVIGHLIDQMLTALSSRKNIFWFKTEAEALAYAEKFMETTPTP